MEDAAENDDWLLSRRQHDLSTGASFHSPVEGYAVHSLDGECCPAVVDKSIFFGTLAFIAAGTAYLVTALLGNALLNGLNLDGITAAITNLINTLTAQAANIQNAVNTLIETIQGLIPGKRRRRAISDLTILFMAGTTKGAPSDEKSVAL